MQKNGYPHYEIILPHRTRYRHNTGHGPGRGIGRRSGATAARCPNIISRTGRVPTPDTAADGVPARATPAITTRPVAACRSVIRPGYSARTRPRPAGSTHGLPLRISDRAKVRTSRKARFAANTRTTSAYSRTPHGARHKNKPRNKGCTPVPHTRFRPEHHPDRRFSQKNGPNPRPPPRTACGIVRTFRPARSLRRTHGTAPPAAAAASRQFPSRIRETNSSNIPYFYKSSRPPHTIRGLRGNKDKEIIRAANPDYRTIRQYYLLWSAISAGKAVRGTWAAATSGRPQSPPACRYDGGSRRRKPTRYRDKRWLFRASARFCWPSCGRRSFRP